jgi:Tfp pilus assembly protein PilF
LSGKRTLQPTVGSHLVDCESSFPLIRCKDDEQLHRGPLVATSLTSSPRTERRLTVLLAILIATSALAVYASAIHNGFVNYDDPDYVTTNRHVLQGLNRGNVVWAFTESYAANWHPITWISHMADVQMFGINPAGHHFTSILLHALNAVLIFLLLTRATGRAFRSAAVAALFALHPLNVEAVAWVAERKSVLCTTFLLLALWAYGWYVRRPGIWRYLCVAAAFALGLMAKPLIITLPFAMLLLDYWPLKRFPGATEKNKPPPFFRTFLWLLAEKIPLLALAAGNAWITIYAQHKGGALGTSLALPLGWRLENAIFSYMAYLGKAVWPSRLAVFYPHPENTLTWWKVIMAIVVLAGITALVYRFRERRYLLTGWLWYLGTMVPMIGIVQAGRQGMADRYAYVPFLGLFVAAVWFVADSSAHLQRSRKFLAGAFVLLLGFYAYLTHIQIGYWWNSYTLFSHDLAVTADNGIAENNLGAAYVELGFPQLAVPYFETSVRLLPEYSTAHYNLGVSLQGQNRREEATRQYQLTIAETSDPIETSQSHNNLGVMQMQASNFDAALVEFRSAIALNPYEQNSYIGRGMIEMQSQNLNAAISDFSRATEISPSPQACVWLGRALETSGDLRRAESAYGAALKLAPGMVDARNRLDALGNRPAK